MIDLHPHKHLIDDLGRGETQRVNHMNCPAGQDTRQRLYITRLAGSGGMVVAYCHNCSDKGVLTDPGTFRDFDKATPVQPTGTAFTVPNGLIFKPSDWPIEAISWRINKSLSETQCVLCGIAYDPSTHRVYLPQWDHLEDGMVQDSSVLTGYQLRKLQGEGPKYLTAQKDKSCTMSTLLLNTDRHLDHVCTFGCIVEDLASGVVMSEGFRRSRYDALVTVNYGTRVSPEVLYLNKTFDFGVVWFDNDGPQIVRQAEKTAKVWAMLSAKPIQIERVLTDPKKVSFKDMINAVKFHREEATNR